DAHGKTVALRLSPYDIQEDFDVDPEAGSYLAVDDELRQGAAMRMAQVATEAPDVVDRRKIVRFALSTIRGIGNPDDYILPPPQGPQPPPTKLNFTISSKFEDLPLEVQQAILGAAGLPESDELNHEATLKGVQKIAAAANAATDLTSPAVTPEQQAADSTKGVRKPGVPGFKGQTP